MNIYDQAMAIEKEGGDLYRRLATEASNKGMQTIFTWLAEQEDKHYGVFKKMKEGQPVSVQESTILSDVQGIFDEWKVKLPKIKPNTPQKELYKTALEVEKKSVAVYGEYAKTASEPQKAIFLQIAAEEKAHQSIVESLIEFITKPEVWAENAEFSHVDKDYYL